MAGTAQSSASREPSTHASHGWVEGPAQFKKSGYIAIAKRTFARISDMDISLRCAGVAFYGFLSIFPAIAAGVAIYALVANPATLSDHLQVLSGFLPAEAVGIINEQVTSLSQEPQALGWGLAISLGLALWSGSRGINALVHAISKSQMENNDRGFVDGALISIGFTLAGFLLVALIFAALAIVPAVVALFALPGGLETAAIWLRWPLIAVLVFGFIVLLFKKAPHRSDPLVRWIVPGALISTTLWLLGSIALSFYVENFGNYDATFGSIATAAILMLWLNFSATVFVLGAIMNSQMELETRADTTVGPVRPRGQRGALVADTLASEMTDKQMERLG